ncbi:thioredoxin family protein [Limibaculum sp. M0105]|uniref:Thioredoxin family protein n=1 Tax=Thermohalobaculum xanthum TaxID=2753746 RepID=A0A8J7M4U8_9RHOB|nr:thioredoxin family protein [Thermohalobaculum xanthum]MBK0398339.1 thioredoxin family protein [Thermohalobaculum xanthum]
MRILAAAFAVVAIAFPAIAAPLGDDGLHKPDWLRETFKVMAEDLEEASAEGKRMLVIFEQRGCIYCTKMHEEVFPTPEVNALLREKYFVVQMNLFGDVEVTDFDGVTLPEKEMAARWGVLFTPTLLFMPEEVPEGGTAAEAAVVVMPGAFEKTTTRNLLTWVLERGYDGEEHFQKYHARNLGPATQ